jgi:hypothetical protein
MTVLDHLHHHQREPIKIRIVIHGRKNIYFYYFLKKKKILKKEEEEEKNQMERISFSKRPGESPASPPTRENPSPFPIRDVYMFA